MRRIPNWQTWECEWCDFMNSDYMSMKAHEEIFCKKNPKRLTTKEKIGSSKDTI